MPRAHARHDERAVRKAAHVVFARPDRSARACRWPSTPAPPRPPLRICAARAGRNRRRETPLCTRTFAGSMPSARAAASRSGDCICVPSHRSQPSARTSARQLSGSIGECDEVRQLVLDVDALGRRAQRRLRHRRCARHGARLRQQLLVFAAQTGGGVAPCGAFVPVDLSASRPRLAAKCWCHTRRHRPASASRRPRRALRAPRCRRFSRSSRRSPAAAR